tara:strand:- start:495 stop:842 length:348 start_codon:yes stop_codon:yes gene_type:complete
MADSPISLLTPASALAGTEALPIVQSSTTKKTTVQDIAELVVAPLYTVELIDVLTVDFYAPLSFSIDSITNIVNAPTTTILVAGASYTLGTSIAIGAKITVTVSTAAVVQLITSL